MSFLAVMAGLPSQAAMATVLRRIVAGERGPELCSGLDQFGATIVTRVLDSLADSPTADQTHQSIGHKPPSDHSTEAAVAHPGNRRRSISRLWRRR